MQDDDIFNTTILVLVYLGLNQLEGTVSTRYGTLPQRFATAAAPIRLVKDPQVLLVLLVKLP